MNEINKTAAFLMQKGFLDTQVGIVLGTGLGHLVEHIETIKEISYKEIPHFPISTVESHAGKLIYGNIAGKKIIAMQGRFHYYEGYSMQQIVFPVRVMKMMGIQQLLLSNASGCLNPNWRKGELMLIDDHINLQPTNPLIGKNIDELGPRFPDMSSPYSKAINQQLERIASKKNIRLHKGVYAAVPGPMLETRAEYRYLRNIGADTVGMSTVPEVIVANHMGLPCAAVSVLTDECNPDNLKPVSLEEIIAVASKAQVKLSELFVELIHGL
ncbi:MAG: purine-nucleoside phosphorylase [Bacteroidota bacterium]